MQIKKEVIRKRNIFEIQLDFQDIEQLKIGNTIAERYDGEHKINISCFPEHIGIEDWMKTESVGGKMTFDTYTADLDIQLSMYDICHALINRLVCKEIKLLGMQTQIYILMPYYHPLPFQRPGL